jgi:hypothetical protein
VSSFQTGNHQELRIFAKREGSQADERAVHKKLEGHRVRGEWFERWAALDEFGLPLDDYARSELNCLQAPASEQALRTFIQGTLKVLFALIAEAQFDEHETQLRFSLAIVTDQRNEARRAARALGAHRPDWDHKHPWEQHPWELP